MDEDTWQDILCVREHRTGQLEALQRLAAAKLFDSNHLFHKRRWARLRKKYQAYFFEDADRAKGVPLHTKTAAPGAKGWVDKWVRMAAPALSVAIADLPDEELEAGGKAAYDWIVNAARNGVEETLLDGWSNWKRDNRPVGLAKLEGTGSVNESALPVSNWLAEHWAIEYDDPWDQRLEVPGPRAARLQQEQRDPGKAQRQARKKARKKADKKARKKAKREGRNPALIPHTITAAEHEANREKYAPKRVWKSPPRRWNGWRMVEELVLGRILRKEQERRKELRQRDEEILASWVYGFSDEELAERYGMEDAKAVRDRRYRLRKRQRATSPFRG